MNLILIQPQEWHASSRSGEIVLDDRRFDYIAKIHQPTQGDQLRCGLLGGKQGIGEVLEITPKQIRLRINFDQEPPCPSLASLILALPRPKVLRRLIQAVTTLGVKDIYLINSYRVEKSFWQTPFLQPESLHQQLLLGLEQGQDTLLPRVHLRKRFKPFIEDELTTLVTNKPAYLAHPRDIDTAFPTQITHNCYIAIGPEGGFIPYEVDQFQAIGFHCGHLGTRILKVETAVNVALSRCL